MSTVPTIRAVEGFTRNASTVAFCAGHAAGWCGKTEIETACSEVANKLLNLGTSPAIDLTLNVLESDSLEQEGREFTVLMSGVKSLLALVILFAGNRALKDYNIPGHIGLAIQISRLYESRNMCDAMKNFAALCLVLKAVSKINLVHYLYNKLRQGVEIVSVKYEIKPVILLPELPIKEADKIINLMNVFWSVKYCKNKIIELVKR